VPGVVAGPAEPIPATNVPSMRKLLDAVVVGVGHVDGLGAEHRVDGQPHAVESAELAVARSRRPPGGDA